MQSPHDLMKESPKFSKAFHGYSPDEVDAQIDYLMEQYTDLYRANDELERKLRTATAQIDAYKKDEESIRSALVNAQKAGGKLIHDANERCAELFRSAKDTCNRMIRETSEQLAEQYEILAILKKETLSFKTALLGQYAAQVDLIQKTTEKAEDLDTSALNSDDLIRRIVTNIKKDADKKAENGDLQIPKKRPVSAEQPETEAVAAGTAVTEPADGKTDEAVQPAAAEQAADANEDNMETKVSDDEFDRVFPDGSAPV